MDSLRQPVGAAVELNNTTATYDNPSNHSGGVVFVDLDPVTNILTLDSQDRADFDVFTSALSNIQFSSPASIVGITLLEDNYLAADKYDEYMTGPFVVPTLSFTSNSILITYDLGMDVGDFYFTGRTATFRIETLDLPPVPLPAAAWLFGSAILGLVGVASRKKA